MVLGFKDIEHIGKKIQLNRSAELHFMPFYYNHMIRVRDNVSNSFLETMIDGNKRYDWSATESTVSRFNRVVETVDWDFAFKGPSGYIHCYYNAPNKSHKYQYPIFYKLYRVAGNIASRDQMIINQYDALHGLRLLLLNYPIVIEHFDFSVCHRIALAAYDPLPHISEEAIMLAKTIGFNKMKPHLLDIEQEVTNTLNNVREKLFPTGDNYDTKSIFGMGC